jgi:hypothetical protein
LYILFDQVFSTASKDEIKALFVKTLKTPAPASSKRERAARDYSDNDEAGATVQEDKTADFRKGLSEYLLTRFYVKKRKDGELDGGNLKAKFKVVFDIINKE